MSDKEQGPELCACPFCGKAPEYERFAQGPKEHGPGAYWPEQVHCGTCNILFRSSGGKNTGEAVRLWNRATADRVLTTEFGGDLDKIRQWCRAGREWESLSIQFPFERQTLMRYGLHTFITPSRVGTNKDRCDKCGNDFRSGVHFR